MTYAVCLPSAKAESPPQPLYHNPPISTSDSAHHAAAREKGLPDSRAPSLSATCALVLYLNRTYGDGLGAGGLGDADQIRNARYRITVECFDRLKGLGFKDRLRRAKISLTTDVKSLHPIEPGWDRRLGPQPGAARRAQRRREGRRATVLPNATDDCLWCATCGGARCPASRGQAPRSRSAKAPEPA